MNTFKKPIRIKKEFLNVMILVILIKKKSFQQGEPDPDPVDESHIS